MFNYDPTPIFTPNEDFIKGSAEPDKTGAFAWVRSTAAQEYCLKLGLTPSFMVYNGTENRATLWHDGTKFDGAVLNSQLSRYDLPWDREANNSDPLVDTAAKGCVDLSVTPTTFGAKLPPYLPIIFDIESTKTYNGLIDTTEQLLAQIQAWDNRIATYRRFMGWDTELYAYFLRGYTLFRSQLGSGVFTQEVENADRAMMRKLSGINMGVYNWDLPAVNPNNWFAWMDMYGGHIRDNYPFHYDNKWATVTPTYQIYWAKDKSLNGQPIPLDLWQAQIRYLVEYGWNVYLWVSPTEWLLKSLKPYFDYLARYL